MKWIKSKHPGVRYREHPTRKHGIQKDRYFAIRYRMDGKTKEEGLGWASQKWTEQKAAEVLTEIKRNIRIGEGPQTLKEKREIKKHRRQAEEREAKKTISFGEYFNAAYLPTARAHKKPDTIYSETNYYKNWIKPVIGGKAFKDIAPLHIEKIKQNLLKGDRAPRTVEYILAIIRQAWNQARRDGLIDRESPTKEVKKPKINNERQRFLTHEEADNLLTHVRERSYQVYQLCVVSLDCGLRASEIFNLKWQMVDLEAGTLFVADAKGGKSRYAYMTGRVREMFASMDRGGPSEYVFKNRNGQKIVRVSNVFQRSVKDLNLNAEVADDRQKVVFHSLRHSFASHLAQAGVDLYSIQRLMGHSSFEMVQRYSHLSADTLRDAVGRMEAAILNGRETTVIPIAKK